jgi:hypothetical protein
MVSTVKCYFLKVFVSWARLSSGGDGDGDGEGHKGD